MPDRLDVIHRPSPLDSTCPKVLFDNFERAWQRGERPAVADYLEQMPAEDRCNALRQLLLLDVNHRRKSGESPRLSDYGSICSSYKAIIESVFHGLAEQETLSFHGQASADGKDGENPVIQSNKAPSGTAAGVRAFGDYDLLSEIARGGMGVVYKAKHRKLNRVVALKMILSGELAGGEEVERFRAEAEAAAHLDHANIVPVFDVGECEGRHFLAMGYVEGQSLKSLVAKGPLAPLHASELLSTIAKAVHYAHERGIIHRDLKPANVLLDRTGQPRVTDFGLAKRIDKESDLTATGQTMGTPSYMPPEQARGQSEEIGPTADVYSLGALLYDLLTGRPPFCAASAWETLVQVIDHEPVPPRILNASIPVDLETICVKCLQKQPENRYRSASDFAGELDRFLRGEPILARPISQIHRIWRWCRRKPALAIAAGLAISSLLATIIVLLAAVIAISHSRNTAIALAETNGNLLNVFAMEREGLLKNAEKSPRKSSDLPDGLATTPEELSRAVAENHRLRAQILYREAHGLLTNGDRHEARRMFETALSEAADADAPSLTKLIERQIAAWTPERRMPIRKYQLSPGARIGLAAFSNDGDMTVTFETEGIARLWNATDGRLLAKFNTDRAADTMILSPSKKMLLLTFGGTIKVWTILANQPQLWKSVDVGNAVCKAAFSPDESNLIAACVSGDVLVLPLSHDAAASNLTPPKSHDALVRADHLKNVQSAAFTSNCDLVCLCDNEGAINVAQLRTGRIFQANQPTTEVASLAAFDDANGLTIISPTGLAQIWGDRSGYRCVSMFRLFDRPTVAAVSPHSSITVGAETGNVEIRDLPTGERFGEILRHSSPVKAIGPMSDGNRLLVLTADGQLTMWEGVF